MQIGLYRHHKGNYYQVLGISKHSESLEDLVVYQALYGSFSLWVRPAANFFEEITNAAGETVPRFKFIAETITKSPLSQKDY